MTYMDYINQSSNITYIMQDSICLIYLTISIIILMSATVSDVRTREVDDRHWIVLSVMGITIQATLATDSHIHMTIGLMTDILLMTYMFWDRTEGVVGAVVVVVAFLITTVSWATDISNPIACRNIITCLMFVIFLGMYHLKLIRGGADAKALMCVAICFPTYIEVHGLPILWHAAPPISYLFNPPLMTLFVALLISMLYSVYIAAVNIHNGDWHRFMLSRYWTSIDEARESFVWPIIDIGNGKTIGTESYDDADEIYDRLEENGFGRVLVTPMIPFILPITIGFVFTVLLGDPMLSII